MALKRITPPSTWSVSLAEVKDFLKLQGSTSEDLLLVSFLKSAESYAENYMKRSISPQQWELRIDGFPGREGEIELPRPPLATASTDITVNYVENSTTGTILSMDATSLTVDFYGTPPCIYPSYDNEWPEARNEKHAVRIVFNAGYSNAINVPEPIKHWIKLRVGAMFENRESLLVGSGNFVTELPHSYVDGLLDEFVVQMI